MEAKEKAEAPSFISFRMTRRRRLRLRLRNETTMDYE
jgi:hypothetical protein